MLIGWVMSHEYQKEKDKVSINELNQQTDNAKLVILNASCRMESLHELLKIQMPGSYLRSINLDSLESGSQAFGIFYKALQVYSQS